MSPKEKAEELYSKYYNRIEHTFNEDVSGFEKDIVKACALIAVDEIIEFMDRFNLDVEGMKHQFNWWQKVKQEIEKL
jgi:hypothetical protein